MTNKRQEKIRTEAKRRIAEWLQNSSFDEMTVGGSRMRFDMALGLLGGYQFEKPEWMKGKKFNSFVTEQEFNSDEYDQIIDELFDNEFMKMKDKEMQDFYSGKYEVELTNELIEQIVKDKKCGDVESLKDMRDMGAKWNTNRSSVVFPTEFI